MKKSLLSVALLIAMIAAMIVPASAATALDSFFENNGLTARYNETTKQYEDTIDVPLEVVAKKTGSTDEYAAEVTDSRYGSDAAPSFDFKATLSMADVKSTFEKYVNALTGATATAVDTVGITGEMTITVDYDLTTVVVPDTYTEDSKSLAGFNLGADTVYEEVSRKVENLGNYNRLTVKVKLKDGLTVADIKDSTKSSLHDDIVVNCDGVTITDLNDTHKFIVNFSGYTKLAPYAQINFRTVDGSPVAAAVTVYKKSSGSSGGRRDNTVVDNTVTIVFAVDGNTTEIPSIEVTKNGTVDFDKVTYPTKEGYAFDGYYLDANFTEKATGKVTVTKDTTFYARWKKVEEPGNLNTDDHFAYITGYPDGTIKPFDNITREEVATIFYRLLSEDKRSAIETTSNNFSDVSSDRWSNAAVSTMAKGGYIVGYEDGTFKPEANITRAEFVTIVARFNNVIEKEGTPYIDIAGHWAEDYIITANKQGWIDGYSDGTFKPDTFITRADAIQITNRLLVRYVNKDGVSSDAKQWSDNLESSKYYYDILEATNSHEFERQEDGFNENWTKLIDGSFVTNNTVAD